MQRDGVGAVVVDGQGVHGVSLGGGDGVQDGVGGASASDGGVDVGGQVVAVAAVAEI
jgi:hypothetical protein